jgi:hypothetical protein
MVFLPRILSMVNWSMNSYSNTAISTYRKYVSFSLSFLQLLNVNRAVTMTNQNHTSIQPSLKYSTLFSLPPLLLSQSNIPTTSNLMTSRLSSSCHQWWHLRPPRCIIISLMFLVIEGPVRSGFLPIFGKTMTVTGCQVSNILRNRNRTDHDRLPPVF